MLALLTRVFGSRNDRLVKNYARQVRASTALGPTIEALPDDALRAKTDEFRARLKDGAKPDDLAAELRRHVAHSLGRHTAPQSVTVVEELPRLPSGKLDRRRLRG